MTVQKKNAYQFLFQGKKKKLLGVPSLGGGSLKKIYSQTVCHIVMDELQKLECVNSINGMVFDTTRTNTAVSTQVLL